MTLWFYVRYANKTSSHSGIKKFMPIHTFRSIQKVFHFIGVVYRDEEVAA